MCSTMKDAIAFKKTKFRICIPDETFMILSLLALEGLFHIISNVVYVNSREIIFFYIFYDWK